MSCHCACLKGNEIKVIMTPGGGGSSSVSIVEDKIKMLTNKIQTLEQSYKICQLNFYIIM